MPPPAKAVSVALDLSGALSLALANATAWLESGPTGGLATTVTIVGGGVMGLVFIGVNKGIDAIARYKRTIEDERIRAAKEWEEVNRNSLTREVKELKALVKESHRRLTETRSEHTAREREYREDTRQLREQIEMLHETIDRQNREIERLMKATGTVVRSADNLAAATDGLKVETAGLKAQAEGLKQEIRDSGAHPPARDA